jgi:predicted nuclease of predicted toxin-antitoxin system
MVDEAITMTQSPYLVWFDCHNHPNKEKKKQIHVYTIRKC